jgi:hypothetical protein
MTIISANDLRGRSATLQAPFYGLLNGNASSYGGKHHQRKIIPYYREFF